MRILVFGGAGLLGSSLAKRLESLGHAVSIFDIVKTPAWLDKPNVSIDYYQGDIGNFNQVVEAVKSSKPEVIYHLSALLGYACESDPGSAMRVNAMGTFHVLESARLFDVRQVIFSSSVTTFALGLPERRMRDDDPQNPVNFYGVLKLFGEGMGRYYSNQFSIDFRAIRFPSVVGPHTRVVGLASFTTDIIHAAIKKEKFIVEATPETTISLIHVDDCSRALIELSETPEENLSRREYLIDGIRPTPTATKLVNLVKQAIPDADISFKPNQKWQKFLEMYAIPVDDSAARKDWGWSPTYDYAAIIQSFIQAHASNL